MAGFVFPAAPRIHRRPERPLSRASRDVLAVPQGENLWSSRHTINHASMAATHCPKGHPYSGDNVAHDGTDRYCRTCSRARDRAAAPRRSVEMRARYAQLRAAGLSSAEARSAS